MVLVPGYIPPYRKITGGCNKKETIYFSSESDIKVYKWDH
jgi:hypothetical protein